MQRGNQACAPQLLSLHSRAQKMELLKPMCPKPVLCNKGSQCKEKPMYYNQRKPTCSNQDPGQPKTIFSSVQFSSVSQSCLTICDPKDCRTPGFPVHHKFPEHTQTHAHRVSDDIQPSHPLMSPYPPTFHLFQQPDLFQGVSSSYQVAKVLEFQLQHQSS